MVIYGMKRCRMCRARTKKFIDYGKVPLSEEFRTKSKLNTPIVTFPLTLEYCESCCHVQLGITVDQNKIYKHNYFYDYSITTTGRKHWASYAKYISQRFKIKSDDFVVDIGSNTGILLSSFASYSKNLIGIDPSSKHVKMANKKGIPTICDYWGGELCRQELKKYKKPRIITCNNTFDHIQDLDGFMNYLVQRLDSKGVFIVEVPYFVSFSTKLSHAAYLQQIDYMSVKPLNKYLNKFGMEIFDCKEFDFHGGTIRFYIGFHNIHKVGIQVGKYVRYESRLFKNPQVYFNDFKSRLQTRRAVIKRFFTKAARDKKIVAGLGASAKGITMLNYCEITKEDMSFITEKSELKIGRYTPTGIPIVDDKYLKKHVPDYLVILSWNLKREIVDKIAYLLREDIKIVTFIPKVAIYTKSQIHKLK